jgi:polyhydroxybutyrate depolymerase
VRKRRVAIGVLLVGVGIPLTAVVVAVMALHVLDRSSAAIVTSGERRPYLLHVSASYDGSKEVPLVISLHAAAMWPAQQSNLSRWNRLADEHGFLVAYPAGRGIPKIWPDGLEGGDGRDVQFIVDLIDTLRATYRVDEARVYVNGMSNGGGMATTASCRLSERIAAVGLVAAVQVVPSSQCTTVRPMPIIAFHGTADRMAPYNGGPLGDPFNPVKPIVPSIHDWIRNWAQRNQCREAGVVSAAAARVSRLEFSGCAGDAAVVLYTVDGGGHTWPGGKPLPKWLAGSTATSPEATAEMWKFFAAHRLDSK